MATIYTDKDATLDLVRGRKVAVVGYGSQGHAHALNLKDSGVDVRVGLPEESKSRQKAQAAGLSVLTVAEAAREADLIMVLAPDEKQRRIYEEDIAPHLTAGKALFFAHGFNIHYGQIKPPPEVDVVLIAPKAPGHMVRRLFEGGLGWMRYSISDTAEYGDYSRGPRIVNEGVRAEMKKILREIQTGQFAREWILENQAGRASFDKLRAEAKAHPIEEVGRRIRELMSWLRDAKKDSSEAPRKPRPAAQA